MPFPDDLEWNQSGVEPTQAKKNEGWLPEEKPPAEYFNWFFNRTCKAVKFLKQESDKSIDDAKIGNRTITDTVTATSGAGTITNLLSKIGNMIKSITGKSNWYTAPAITLQELFDLIVSTPGANKILKLDANGKLPADVTGNSATATKLATARKINTVPFDGSADINLTPANIGALPSYTTVATGDWNNYINNGPYYGLNLANAPTSGSAVWYWVQVIRHADNYVYQQAHGFGGASQVSWERTQNLGVWSAWKQIATTDQCGVSIGTIMPFLATKAQPGWLAVDTGALVSRATYPDLWIWVQANAPLITEAAWQAQTAAQSSVGYYSSGDGSTTFRLPRIVDFVRGTDGTRLPGTWQGDALQNIVGSTKIVQVADYSTGSGAISSINTSSANISIGGGNGDRRELTFDASRVARTADETRPKSISMLYCVKAFDAPTNQGLIDITALANSVASKIDKNDTGFGTKIWISSDYTPVLNTPTIVSHGLTINPLKCKCDVLLKCISPDNGYSVGDFAISPIEWPSPNQTEYAFAPALTTTTIQQNTGYSGIWSLNKANGVHYQLDISKWRYAFRIWY
jgi:hypothetical protein